MFKHKCVNRLLLLTILIIGACIFMAGCNEKLVVYEIPEAEKGKTYLTWEGKSNYRIIRGKNANLSEINAAEQFQAYIKQITGFKLPILIDTKSEETDLEIVIGRTNREGKGYTVDRDSLGNEGYCIKWVGQKLFITGGESRGTLYGVFHFLEILGCRFFAPDCEVIPETGTLLLELSTDIIEKPAFEFRDVFWACAFDEKWSVKQKINGCLNLFNRSLGRNISEKWGGGLSNAGPQHVHNFEMLVPVDKYFDEHPEYFSEINGVRTSKFLYSQLCLTNEDVLKIVVEQVKKWLQEHPESKIVPISQNDSYVIESYCTCEKCKQVNREERSPSGTLIRFVNSVADSIKDEYPDVYVETLAYQFSAAPPRLTKPSDNVIVRYCTGGCSAHPINKCSLNSGALKNIIKWGEFHNKMYVWDYTTNFAQYLCPFPNLNNLQPNMQFFYESGIKGVFAQGNYQDPISGEFGNLRAYLLAKLLWDPYTDIELHKKEFLDGYYGKGGTSVGEYIDFIHKVIADSGKDFNLVVDAASLFAGLISDDDIIRLDSLWLKAKEDANNDKTALLHVRRSELQYRFYKMQAKKGEFSNRDTFDTNVEQFYKDCHDLGIKMFSEGNPVPWNNN